MLHCEDFEERTSLACCHLGVIKDLIQSYLEQSANDPSRTMNTAVVFSLFVFRARALQ